MRHLLRLAAPGLGDHTDLHFVTTVKARALRFTPTAEGADGMSFWNVDGELLPASANVLRASVEPGLLTMFAFTPESHA